MIYSPRCVLLLLFLSSITLSEGFLNNLFKGSSQNSQTNNNEASQAANKAALDPLTRGIPENNLANYQQEAFLCDNKARRIPKNAVNDNYCDCNDGTDEPGTNACNIGTFTCINKNYRMVRIPSSRVDDGICDCCDGSDEGNVAVCEDTCIQANENEQGHLNQLRENYQTGKRLRQQLIDQATIDRQGKISRIPALRNEIEYLKNALQQLRSEQESAEDSVRMRLQSDTKNQKQELLQLLGLTSANNEEYHIRLFQVLVELAHVDNEKISNYLIDLELKKRFPPGSDEELLEAEDAHDVDEELQIEELSESCDLIRVTRELRYKEFCKDISGNSIKSTLRELIYAMMKEYSPVNELVLVMGHEALHINNFENAIHFTTDFIAEHGVDTCPEEFQQIDCNSLRENLRNIINSVNNIDAMIQEDPEIKQHKDRIQQQNNIISTTENELRDSEQAEKDLNHFKEYPELLALKDTCVEVNDGKFHYKHCILRNVEQKEINGFNSVNLGNFESIEDHTDEKEGVYFFKIHYTNGQYCHAFGARKADVIVRCGKENLLKSAAEPSTCFYLLEMESPAACTPEFASATGIPE